MGVQAVLSIVLLFVATVMASTKKGYVEFWKDEVTLTCPDVGEIIDSTGKTANSTFKYTKKGHYHCDYDDDSGSKIRYMFYVEGKACENCFELNAYLLLMIILVDILGTIILMIMIYRCTKKKSSGGPPQPSKAPPRSGGRAPPVPSPDYAPLNPQTRAQDTYSTVVNRMG
ncbi:T-cell surface glycoprotein CD3 epsilon chain [Archocentrus centrarchus]|uniref:T-cell surface glycoprotein CD3 epsilon chain n=1 Tax=Archocentrus centrarchus TaxID=63155 RepID=UPI0011E9B7BC|nr:T-cell surface glycoprotein CD3 epsilon chain [Archocentrus centrarchus]